MNFSFPNNTEDYVHRIGRTGRAGAKGTAYTFLNAKDMENRRNMSDLVGVLTRCDQEVPALLEVSLTHFRSYLITLFCIIVHKA